jgi:hypothetical protein
MAELDERPTNLGWRPKARVECVRPSSAGTEQDRLSQLLPPEAIEAVFVGKTSTSGAFCRDRFGDPFELCTQT